jgi:integrase
MPKIHTYTAPDGTPRYWFRVDTGRSADGRRHQEKKTFARKKEAEAELARITNERNNGAYVRPSRQTVAELIDEYLKSATFEKEKATVRSYSDALRCPLERLGRARAQDVTRRDVEDLRDYMLREGRKIGGKPGTGLGPRSVILALGRLQAAFALAVADGRLARNPVADVQRPKQAQSSRDTWTGAEVRKFLAEAERDRLYAAWRLSLYGLRRSEVTALRWDGYDRKAKTLTVERARVLVAGEIVEKTPKSANSVRALPLDDETALALDELRKRQMAEGIAAAPAYRASGYIVTDELGAAVHPEWYSDEFHRIAKRAGVRRIRLHEGRHTALSLMEKAGVPTSIIAAWAGHYSAAFTMATYVHANPEDLGSGRDALASIYRARESS